MLARTWPYGTRKRVLVIGITEMYLRPEGPKCPVVTAVDSDATVADADREGYFLFGEEAKPAYGAEVTIVFTQGGPQGGYWKIEEEAHVHQPE